MLVDPLALAAAGRQCNALIELPGPLHDRPDGPADVENDAAIAADIGKEWPEAAPEFADASRLVLLFEPVEVDLKPAVGLEAWLGGNGGVRSRRKRDQKHG